MTEQIRRNDEAGHAFTILRDYVDGLALFEGGETPDVIRSGSMQLSQGRILRGEIMDPFTEHNKSRPQVAHYIFCLTVFNDSGVEIESLTIHPVTDCIVISVEQVDLFADQLNGAPDMVIEDFFARYSLNYGNELSI